MKPFFICWLAVISREHSAEVNQGLDWLWFASTCSEQILQSPSSQSCKFKCCCYFIFLRLWCHKDSRNTGIMLIGNGLKSSSFEGAKWAPKKPASFIFHHIRTMVSPTPSARLFPPPNQKHKREKNLGHGQCLSDSLSNCAITLADTFAIISFEKTYLIKQNTSVNNVFSLKH